MHAMAYKAHACIWAGDTSGRPCPSAAVLLRMMHCYSAVTRPVT